MISLAIEGAVATATMCRPPVNAINEDWVERLDAVLGEVERDASASVLVIRSSARAFCAGADLALMRTIFDSAQGRARMIDLTRRMQEVFARLEALPAVSVAEIGGPAMGGGFELALACDLRIASESARMGLPEARLGLLPAAGGTQRLTRLCGDAMARRLILGAELVAGADAARLGLVHWTASEPTLHEAALGVARRIAELPRDALAACKRCIEAALDPSENGFETELQHSGRLLASPETQRRVTRFLEKGR